MGINIIVLLISIEFIYIFILESIRTNSERTKNIFKLSNNKEKNVRVLLKNLGIYNLIIGLLLISALWCKNYEMIFLLLISIDIIAIYGAVTSQIKILFLQGTLPTIGLILMGLYSIY